MEASHAARTVLARLDFVLQNCKQLLVVYLKPVRQVGLMVCMCTIHLSVALMVSLFVCMARLSDNKKALNARVLDVPNVQ